MAPYRETIERDVLTSDPKYSTDSRKDRHLDCRAVYELAAHPAITSRVASLYGPDLLIYASSLFVKEPGFPTFTWHHDAAYYMMEPVVCLTAWIAVTDTNEENGCVSLLPGSHRIEVPHERFGFSFLSRVKRRLGKPVLKGYRAKREYTDSLPSVSMPVKAGQFFLFTAKMIHEGGGNLSDQRRIGLSVRITVPLVRIAHERIHPEHGAMLIGGEDRLGFNRLRDPPPSE